jgi:hypothetical protein
MRSGARRLIGETVSFTLDVPTAGGDTACHHVDMNMAYAPDGTLHEIAFCGRGKIGTGVDLLLQDLSVKASRALQSRDPDTGDAVPSAWRLP